MTGIAIASGQEKGKSRSRPGRHFSIARSVFNLAFVAAVVAVVVFLVVQRAGARQLVDAVSCLIVACVLLAMLLMLTPIYLYVKKGLRRKREQIKGYYSPRVIAEYINRFVIGSDDFSSAVADYRKQGLTSQTEKVLEQKFRTLLDEYFGRAPFWWPILLLVATAGLILFVGFSGGIELAQHLTEMAEATANVADTKNVVVPDLATNYYFGIKIDLVSLAAIFGAYCWITADALGRYHQENMQPSDVLGYAFRFVIAIPIGQAVAVFALSKDAAAQAIPIASAGPLLAFFLNALSYDQIIKILMGFTSKYLGTGAEQEKNDLVVNLPGVDSALAERFKAEGITTIAQIAAADPIRLSIRTNQPFSFILELIDEALLWNFVREDLTKLALVGWKGASHILSYVDEGPHRSVADRIKALEDNVAAKLAAQSLLDKATAAAASQPGADAQAAMDQAQRQLTQASNEIETARSQLAQFFADEDATFAELAKVTGVDAAGLRGILRDISGNAYARFISKLMQVGATSSADPIGVKGGAAVPS